MEAGEQSITETEIRAQLSDLTARYGEWECAIPLPFGIWTRGEQLPHTRLRRIVQIAHDLSPIPLHAARVLDLGCFEGQFSIEFARHGSHVLGVEIRERSIRKAEFLKRVFRFERLDFLQADARSVRLEAHGAFDIVLCSGLLYHLKAEEAASLVCEMHRLTNHLLIIDTHISLRPEEQVVIDGWSYHGHCYVEHSLADSEEKKAARTLASWKNENSFWFSRPSLINLLAHAGFSSVYECFNPPHINFGRPGQEHQDRCTIVAYKRSMVPLITSPGANATKETWPEGSLSYSTNTCPSTTARLASRWVSRIRRRLGQFLTGSV